MNVTSICVFGLRQSFTSNSLLSVVLTKSMKWEGSSANKGINSSHNPEFTTYEMYSVHSDYHHMMKLTSQLLRRVARCIHGEELKVPYNVRDRPVVLDFKSNLGRHDYMSCLESALGVQLPPLSEIEEDSLEMQAYLFSLCLKNNIVTGEWLFLWLCNALLN